jgi:3',5'-cyclic AMP phosphodiesterase CpdA
MLIAQITDCHIVEPGRLVADRIDSAVTLTSVIDAINAHRPRIDLVLATGDLVNDGTPVQYDRLIELLQRLDAPVVPIPGNHDDRTEMRLRFGDVLPLGPPDEPIDFVVDDHQLRLIGLDTTIPGEHRGRLTEPQLAWLDAVLADGPSRPTLVFQHHPPFVTGIPFMDRYGLQGAAAQADVVARHRNVEGVVAGHIHRAVQQRFGGTVASCWPSTGAQVALELGDGPVVYTDEPPAFAVHRWDPGTGLTSHLAPVLGQERWTPAWALAGESD